MVSSWTAYSKPVQITFSKRDETFMISGPAEAKRSAPQVSVCIVTYGNRKQDLKRALESAFKYSSPVTIEVIVVDNASTDDSLQMIAEGFSSVISTSCIIHVPYQECGHHCSH